MSLTKRYFTIVIGSKETGRYISSNPSSAAKKVVSRLCSVNKHKKVEFCIRETTQFSKKKVYGPYLGNRKKRAKPLTVMIAGKKITYKYDSTVRSLKDQKGGKKWKFYS